MHKPCLQALASSCKHCHSKSRIQDSRFKKNFKIQDSRSKKNFLNPESWIQDSSFKIQKELLESHFLPPERRGQGLDSRSCFWILTLESWIRDLDSRKAPENLESWILNPGLWIQEVLFGSWILNLESTLLASALQAGTNIYLPPWFPRASVQPTTLSSPRTVWSQRLLVELLRAWLLGLHRRKLVPSSLRPANNSFIAQDRLKPKTTCGTSARLAPWIAWWKLFRSMVPTHVARIVAIVRRKLFRSMVPTHVARSVAIVRSISITHSR